MSQDYSSIKSYNDLCGVLHEFTWKEIHDWDELKRSVATEAVLFVSLKLATRKIVKKSKVHRGLSEKVSDLVQDRWKIRIISDASVNSFSDDKDTIYVTSGLANILDTEELLAVCLHELGHGDEKLKLLYNKMIRHKRVRFFNVFAPIIKKQLNTPSLNKTSVYLMAHMLYMSTNQPPFKGAYKWSYHDLALKLGYWDQYESAVAKIDRHLHRQLKDNQSKIANDIVWASQNRDKEAVHQMVKPMTDNLKRNDDSFLSNVKSILGDLKIKADVKDISKMIRSIFRS